MRTIKTNRKELIAVGVPMEATKPKVDAGLLLCIIEKNGGAAGTHYSLPKGDYEILGTLTNGVPDFDVEPYVQKDNRKMFRKYKAMYLDYNAKPKLYAYSNPVRSFLSLLQSHSIEYANKKLVILLKK